MTLHNRTQTFLFSPPRLYQSGNSPRSAQSFRDSRSPRSSPSTLPAGDRPRTQRHSVQRPPPKTLRIPPKPAPGPALRHPAPIVPRRKPPDLPRPKAPEPPAENPARAGDSAASHGDLRRNSAKLPPEPIFRTFQRRPPSLSSTGSPADLRTTKSAPPRNGNAPRTQEGHKTKASRKQEGTTGPVSLAAPSLLAFICRLSA